MSASSGDGAAQGDAATGGSAREGRTARNDASNGSLTADLEARIAELDAIAWNLPGPRAGAAGSGSEDAAGD